MRSTARPANRGNGRSVKKVEEPSHRPYDVLGVVFIALALVTVASLTVADSGLVGQALGGFFRTLFGQAAWVAPVALAAVGVLIIAGRRTVGGLNRVTFGVLLLFLTLAGSLSRPVGGDYFDPRALSESGGYIGALLGWAFSTLLGSAAAIGFWTLGMCGLILCLNAPLISFWNTLRQPKRPRVVVKEPNPVRERPAPRIMTPPTPEPIATREPEPAPNKREPVVRESNTPMLEQNEQVPKEGYQLPPMSLLSDPPDKPKRSPQEMQRNIDTLEGTLEEFGIDANVVEVATGPTVTRYEIQLGPGIKVNRIVQLADNIAMNLAASHVRVEAPIPGKAAIGVEVPNSARSSVAIRELCQTKEFLEHPSKLAIALGQDVSGINRYADLTKMPHLLIGGATNSGKSIGLASIITSLLMRNTPKDLKFVMIDPKRVELSLFDRIPHLLCPVIKDVKEAPGVLRAVWREMDRRYDQLSEAGVRNIDGWNAKASFQDRMSYIVVIIDELADLMIQAAAEVETSICRLAQLARATGIHLVVATQRPSVDVITGTIKANISSRVAFSVSSQIDSRTILDQKGAEDLVGRGDMLFLPIDASKPIRIQGCYVSEQEIDSICKFWRSQQEAQYAFNPADFVVGESGSGSGGGGEEEGDEFWEPAVRWVAERGQASTSMLQRRFSIGFQRASRLLDAMEERGIVGPREGARPREVLMDVHEIEHLFGGGRSVGRAAPPPRDDDEELD
ncbi:MAG: cell division protein FtsK [Chthonomonas sp.]